MGEGGGGGGGAWRRDNVNILKAPEVELPVKEENRQRERRKKGSECGNKLKRRSRIG